MFRLLSNFNVIEAIKAGTLARFRVGFVSAAQRQYSRCISLYKVLLGACSSGNF